MSGASDKARFHLEQAVPELQELSRKKVFTRDEISSIIRKRSDFEHKLNARGSVPSDFVRYVEYEMNLESLRRKRTKRLGAKATTYTGQRRVFSILYRATRKFPGDLRLWMQYIVFARKQKSNKKVSQVLTSVLRLHPTKAELWIYAANESLEERADITEARSYMQRGLRFCKYDQRLWLEYARLEMIWIAKIAGRRRILGLDRSEEKRAGESVESVEGDIIPLPKITANDINPNQHGHDEVDQEALERLNSSPALSGAIPIAIFDAATKQQFKDPHKFSIRFFDTIAEFNELPCTGKILQHTMETLNSSGPVDPATLTRSIQQPVVGTSAASPLFPKKLGESLDRIKSSFETLGPASAGIDVARSRIILGQNILRWILNYLKGDDLDSEVRIVLGMTLRRIWNLYQLDLETDPNDRAADVGDLLAIIQLRGVEGIVTPAKEWALRTWPQEPKILALVNTEEI